VRQSHLSWIQRFTLDVMPDLAFISLSILTRQAQQYRRRDVLFITVRQKCCKSETLTVLLADNITIPAKPVAVGHCLTISAWRPWKTYSSMTRFAKYAGVVKANERQLICRLSRPHVHSRKKLARQEWTDCGYRRALHQQHQAAIPSTTSSCLS